MIRVISDIHLEFFSKITKKIVEGILPTMEDDSKTILIMAGDICPFVEQTRMKCFLDEVCKRFKKILYVFGNHEYYGSEYGNNVINNFLKTYKNLIALDDSIHEENGNVFIGTTLWTKFTKVELMMECARRIGDYRAIKYKQGILTPIDTANFHDRHINFLTKALNDTKGKKQIVITHHVPSEQSSHPMYRNSVINEAFFTNLEKFILKHQPSLWIHGHMHTSSDYMIDKTRIICNPYGYKNSISHENEKGYISNLLIDRI